MTEELGTDQEFLGDLTTRCAEKKKECRGLLQSKAPTSFQGARRLAPFACHRTELRALGQNSRERSLVLWYFACFRRFDLVSCRFEHRTSLRANEEAAIAQAISILNSDAAFATFDKVRGGCGLRGNAAELGDKRDGLQHTRKLNL